MLPIVKTLFEICLLRGLPQDLPASRNLVAITALLSMASTYALDQLHEDMLRALMFAASQTILMGAIGWLILTMRGYQARWMQMIAPIYAANTLVDVVKWLVISQPVHGQELRAPWEIWFVVALAGWFIAIMAHILRHALAISMALGVLVSLSWILVSGVILVLLFPELLPR